MYLCPSCASPLAHRGGYDKSGPEYGGAYLDVDLYTCPCGREFKKVVKENFGSGFIGWYRRNGDDWDLLPDDQRPRSS